MQGTNFDHGRIMCIQALPPHHLALGTQLGRVWLYDTRSNELKHSSAQLQDSVLCMKHIIGYVTYIAYCLNIVIVKSYFFHYHTSIILNPVVQMRMKIKYKRSV